MQDNQEQKERKRSIRNVANGNTADNLVHQSNDNKQNSGDNSQIQVYSRNSQDNQVDVSNKENQNTIINQDNQDINKDKNNPNGLNHQLNIDSPAPLSNEPILVPQNQPPISQSTNNNPNRNTENQLQHAPTQNYPILANQLQYPQNKIVIIQQAPINLPIIGTNKYTPTNLTCLYCQKKVTSVPHTKWSCRSCCKCVECSCFYTVTFCIGFLLHLCVLWCTEGDWCCCEAEHRCPYCNNIIATRGIKLNC